MRIIGGKWKGRPLAAVRAPNIRPTTDRVREAIFSALFAQLAKRGMGWEGLRVVDLYAGTGALGFEALSRGAAFALLVEQDRRSAKVIRGNLEKLDAAKEASLVQCEVAEWFERPLSGSEAPYNVVFADPPYAGGEAAHVLDLISRSAKVAPGALVVVERSGKDEELPIPAGLKRLSVKNYGDTSVEFFEKPGS